MLGYGTPTPTADLVALIVTPYDIDIVHRDALGDGEGVVRIEQPKPLLAASFSIKHTDEWLAGAQPYLLVVVTPDLNNLVNNFSKQALLPCWFAMAQILHAK